MSQLSSEGHDTHALAARVRFSNSQNQFQNPKAEGKRCRYCKKPGHTHQKCWFLHPNLKLKRGKGSEKGGDQERKWNGGDNRAVWGGEKIRLEHERGEKGFNTHTAFSLFEPRLESSISRSQPADPMQQVFHQFLVWYIC